MRAVSLSRVSALVQCETCRTHGPLRTKLLFTPLTTGDEDGMLQTTGLEAVAMNGSASDLSVLEGQG